MYIMAKSQMPPCPTITICKTRNSSANIKGCAAEIWQSQVSLGRTHVVFPGHLVCKLECHWKILTCERKSFKKLKFTHYLKLLVNFASGKRLTFSFRSTCQVCRTWPNRFL